ncbi:MAG: PKD domain-containing protein [Thermoplasmatales archaeon]|nr:PKD domain-containing protein [Thermoplasmatales archaeon]
MKKIMPICIMGILILSGFGAVALNSDNEELDFETIDFENTGGGNRDYTHTVLVEVGTGSWCYWCQFTNAVMHDIYANGDYDFEYVELVDSNPIAVQRINEYNQHSYPTSFFDGGYEVLVGGYDTWPSYTSKMDLCGARAVPDIYATMDVFWLGGEQMDIDVSIQNNEASEYTGHLRVYVVEIVSRWKDSGNADYNHGFLDYAFNQDISIPAGESFTANTVWDGSSWNNPDITMDNIQVILAVFNSEWHQGYADPPSGDPFDAYYNDETIAATPSASGAPNKPNPPSGPTSGVIDVEYTYTGSTTDPDGDDIYYLFDWGDGTDSGWLGPYASGTQVEASHTWTYANTFGVRLKAKDTMDGPWSDPLSVEIAGPRIEIGSIDGGLLKVGTVIQNDGDIEFTDVNWKITLAGGAFIGKETTGEGLTVPANGEATISSGLIFGFGPTEITVEAWIQDGPSDMRQQDGFVFLFFVKVNPGGGI